MGRRFPTPIIGVPTDPNRYQTVIKIAADSESGIGWSVFQDRCREELRKPGTNEQYSESYISRILSTYAEIGVVDRDNGSVHPSPFATDYLTGNLTFSEFLWKSLKRSWVAMGTKPEGIEGLERILCVLEDNAEGMSQGEIRSTLAEDYGYEFNDQGIRGYLPLLVLLGVAEKNGETYTVSSEETVNRYKRRFRNTDIFDTLETRLKREGSTVKPPSQAAKRDMMKYYMYRESGGWNKRRQWYKTFWSDYLDPDTREGTTGSELRRKQKYRDAHSRRSDLRDQIIKSYPSFDSQALRGLSAGILKRMLNADDEQGAHRIRISAGSGMSRADLELLQDKDRASYTFPSEFALYNWQQEAANQWFSQSENRRPETGIAQVVTGAGKTVMALEIIRQWIQEGSDDRVATIVVPTKVLMHQWLTELVSKLNVPINESGWAGGGHKDDFEDCRIIVSIVNSAVKNDYLNRVLDDAGRPNHLLIADECHRYTGDKFSNIFDYHRTASLGLSATPVSREDELTESDKLLLKELGEIYYKLTYDEGIQQGLIPEFTIEYVGFDLAQPEQREYDELSRKVSNAVKEIHQMYERQLYELSGSFSQKLHVIRNNADGPTGAIADYFQYTQERRELVANAVARQAITLHLLRDAVDTDQKTIVFQERIRQLEQLISPWEHRGVNARTKEVSADDSGYRQRLYETFDGLETVDRKIEELFERPDYWPVMYHSGHSRDVWNDIAMDWFREDDMANVMLSVKALVEGVDVPSADVGIVRVSSSSIRQRIQTLGRILRTGEDATQESTLYVLYARDTVDERIFEEYDWQDELASAKVNHKVWQRDGESYATGTIRPATPKEYPPRPEPEIVPDADELDLGDKYEGTRDPVKQVSVDSQGRLFRKTRDGRQYISTDEFKEQIAFVRREKGGGTIIINEQNHMLTVLKDGPVFLGVVDDPDIFEPDVSPDRVNETEAQIASDGTGSLTEDPDDFDDIFG